MTKPTSPKYAPEVRERAVRMVFEHDGEHASPGAAISSIAAKIGCTAKTLPGRVRQAERDQGKRPGPTTDERERIHAHRRLLEPIGNIPPAEAEARQYAQTGGVAMAA